MPRRTVDTIEALEPLETLATPIWIFDVDRYGIWWANQAAVTFWRAPNLEQLRARDFSSDSASVLERLRGIVDTPGADGRLRDTWILFPGGEPKTVDLNLHPVLIGPEKHNGLLIELIQRVDSQEDADAARLLDATRGARSLISSYAKDGALLAQNPAAASCYAARDAARREGASDFETLFSDPCDAERFQAALEAGKDIEDEVLVDTPNGARVHRIRARLGRDAVTGDAAFHVTEDDATQEAWLRTELQTLNDALEARITERTARLRDSEERYALATQTAWIFDWNIPGHHLFVSPQVYRAMGYDKAKFDALIDSGGFYALIHEDDREEMKRDVIRHLKDASQIFEKEVRFLTADGEERWLHIQGKSIHGPQGRAVRSVGLLTDVSERKALEASLLAAQRLEAIGQLTGGIAHDFNNLLTVIRGNAELLEEVGHLDPTLIAAIAQATERGADLTRHLLAFARKQTLAPASVDLTHMLGTMRRTVLRAIGGQITIRTKLPKDLWPLQADPTQLETAILNLAINARDAMPLGGTLSVQCRNRVVGLGPAPALKDGVSLAPGEYVEIRMSDTGSGMSAADTDRAFEPFFTTKEVGQGSGLGLSMVYGFCRQSGGGAAIQSTQKEGTTVSLYLPRAYQPPERPNSGVSVPVIRGAGEHIHVLEDNPSVRDTLCRVLKAQGYRVSHSSSASEALASITQGVSLPDLVLADIILPGGANGFDFARQLAAMETGIQIVLISGYPDDAVPRMNLANSEFLFIQKPFSHKDLSLALNAALKAGAVTH